MALTNTVATIPGIVVPIFVGVLTHGNVSNTSLFTSAKRHPLLNMSLLFIASNNLQPYFFITTETR